MNEPEFGAIDTWEAAGRGSARRALWYLIAVIVGLLTLAVVADSGLLDSDRRTCCHLCNCGAKLRSSGT
jgi:hypothetical protein